MTKFDTRAVATREAAHIQSTRREEMTAAG